MNQKTPLFILLGGIVAIIGVIAVARTQFQSATSVTTATNSNDLSEPDTFDVANSLGIIDGRISNIESNVIYLENEDNTVSLTESTSITETEVINDNLDNPEVAEKTVGRDTLEPGLVVTVDCIDDNIEDCQAENIFVSRNLPDDELLESLENAPTAESPDTESTQ